MINPESSARTIGLVAAGVSLGALARWAIITVDVALWATLVANVAGCLVAGVAGRYQPAYRAFWVTGVAGGLSTLSAVGVDVRTEWMNGSEVTAVAYVLITATAGVMAAVIGRGDAATRSGEWFRS